MGSRRGVKGLAVKGLVGPAGLALLGESLGVWDWDLRV